MAYNGYHCCDFIALSFIRVSTNTKETKIKELELEFEREATKILSEAERDLPETPVESTPEIEHKDEDIRFCRSQIEPSMQILQSWRSLEIMLRKLAKDKNVKADKSTRSLLTSLHSEGVISEEVVRVSLDLAALRNKVAHTDEEAISDEASSAYLASIIRVKSILIQAHNAEPMIQT